MTTGAKEKKNTYALGMALACLAAVLWSGNYIVARGVHQKISPVSLAFFRWLTATLVLLPFALKQVREQWPLIRLHLPLFSLTALLGVTLFNTFIYIAGKYIPAINLAVIGTTAAPVFVLFLSRLFLKEKVSTYAVSGTILCAGGILLLMSKGVWSNLRHFRLSVGDIWILLAALSFAFYTILVRRKPKALSPLPFLFILFLLGTLFLVPAYIADRAIYPSFVWSPRLLFIFLYLGIGASVGAFLCWNVAIHKIGAAKTALFANLIPVFSSIEAVLILGEESSWVTYVSLLVILLGLLLANYHQLKQLLSRH